MESPETNRFTLASSPPIPDYDHVDPSLVFHSLSPWRPHRSTSLTNKVTCAPPSLVSSSPRSSATFASSPITPKTFSSIIHSSPLHQSYYCETPSCVTTHKKNVGLAARRPRGRPRKVARPQLPVRPRSVSPSPKRKHDEACFSRSFPPLHTPRRPLELVSPPNTCSEYRSLGFVPLARKVPCKNTPSLVDKHGRAVVDLKLPLRPSPSLSPSLSPTLHRDSDHDDDTDHEDNSAFLKTTSAARTASNPHDARHALRLTIQRLKLQRSVCKSVSLPSHANPVFLSLSPLQSEYA